MKEQILALIEEDIQQLREELSKELDNGGHIMNNNSIIIVSKINTLRNIKRKINNI